MADNIKVTAEGIESEEVDELELGYKQMSEDEEREAEALEWIEGCLNDICL
jgi:hypothetical protein